MSQGDILRLNRMYKCPHNLISTEIQGAKEKLLKNKAAKSGKATADKKQHDAQAGKSSSEIKLNVEMMGDEQRIAEPIGRSVITKPVAPDNIPDQIMTQLVKISQFITKVLKSMCVSHKMMIKYTKFIDIISPLTSSM